MKRVKPRAGVIANIGEAVVANAPLFPVTVAVVAVAAIVVVVSEVLVVFPFPPNNFSTNLSLGFGLVKFSCKQSVSLYTKLDPHMFSQSSLPPL